VVYSSIVWVGKRKTVHSIVIQKCNQLHSWLPSLLQPRSQTVTSQYRI